MVTTSTLSKDTRSSDSSKSVFVRKVREMDVAVNGLNFELVVCERMLTTLERELLAGSVVREEKQIFCIFP